MKHATDDAYLINILGVKPNQKHAHCKQKSADYKMYVDSAIYGVHKQNKNLPKYIQYHRMIEMKNQNIERKQSTPYEF